MHFTRISKGLNNYTLMKTPVDIAKIIESAGNSDYYYGIFTYEQKHFDHWSKTRSLSGITDVKINALVWDFDDTDIERARRDARDVYSKLVKLGFQTNDIQIYFSGNKGFHLIIELSEFLTRKEFEAIVFNRQFKLQSLDPKVKDHQRLLRLPFTRHNSSGLYKIPLTLETFNSKPISAIKEQATCLHSDDWELYQSWKTHKVSLPEAVKQLIYDTSDDTTTNVSEVKFEDRVDLTRKPKWLSSTKFALQEGFFKKGERNTAFMVLAATYKDQGLPKEITWRLLKGVAELQAKRTNSEEYSADKLWKEVISCVYSNNWRGGTYSEKETELLRVTSDRFNLSNDDTVSSGRLVTYGNMRDKILELAKDYSNQRLFTGLKQIDDNIVIIKGMCFGILGAPNAGKTTVVNHIVNHLAVKNKQILFESLDMSDVMMGVKPALYKLDGNYDFNTLLLDIEQGKNIDNILTAFNAVDADQKNIVYNYKSSTVEDIELDIRSFHHLRGQYPDLVVVDYFEKIRGPKGDPHTDAHYIIPRLTDLAKEYNVCIALLLQPQKVAGDMNEPLLSMRNIKGSSIIEQDLRLIFTLWRPGANREDPNDDRFMQMAVVKNNMGPLGRYKFAWNGRAGKIADLTRSELSELDQLLDTIDAEKAQQLQSRLGNGSIRKTL